MPCSVFKRPFLILAIFIVFCMQGTGARAFSIDISQVSDSVTEIEMEGGKSSVGRVEGCVEGSGRIASDRRSLPAFISVIIEGSFTVEIEEGREQLVQVSGDDNIVDLISTSVKEGKLTVSLNRPVCPATELKVVISAQDICDVVSDGANDVAVRNVRGQSFSISLKGASDARVSGETGLFTAVIEGAGTLHAEALRSRHCRVRISGSGDAEVFASEMLEAAIEGAGDITYFGGPAEIKKQITGAGEIVSGD